MNWKSAAGIAIGALFLYMALRGIDLAGVGAELGSADPAGIAFIVVTAMVNMWLRAARWRYMLRRDHAIPTYRLFKIVMIGFMANNVLPARLGELVRAHALGQREGVSRTYAFASIVLERILDAFAIVFIMVCVYAVSLLTGTDLPGWVAKSGLMLAAGLVAMVAGLLVLRFRFDALTAFIGRMTGYVVKSEAGRERALGFVRKFFEGLGLIRTPGDVFAVWAYSMGVWGTIVVMCEFAIRAVGVAGLPPYASSVVTFLLVLGVMVPGAPGFVGTIQYFFALGLGLFGVGRTVAVSASVVYHACQFVPVTLAGLIYYWSGHLSLKGLAGRREA